MVLEETNVQNSANIAPTDMEYPNIGRTVKTALLKADAESRVIVGLSAAIKMLSKVPEESLICLLAEPQAGDSATHMHEVLLEAFCYENDIYVIKVDCATKLSRILGKNIVESCCLIQKTWTEEENENLNKSENILVDYCEAYWDSPTHPVVKLPAVVADNILTFAGTRRMQFKEDEDALVNERIFADVRAINYEEVKARPKGATILTHFVTDFTDNDSIGTRASW